MYDLEFCKELVAEIAGHNFRSADRLLRDVAEARPAISVLRKYFYYHVPRVKRVFVKDAAAILLKLLEGGDFSGDAIRDFDKEIRGLLHKKEAYVQPMPSSVPKPVFGLDD